MGIELIVILVIKPVPSYHSRMYCTCKWFHFLRRETSVIELIGQLINSNKIDNYNLNESLRRQFSQIIQLI